MKKLDYVRSAHKSVTYELAQLKIEKERLEKSNIRGGSGKCNVRR